MTAGFLAVRGLTKRYGGLTALDGVDLTLAPGTITALLGPNGAGKTTLFDIISGLTPPDEGHIHFDGNRIYALPAHRIAGLGIARTFQTTQVFNRLNVVENILLGRCNHTNTSFFAAGFWTPTSYRKEHRARTRAYEILEFLEMYDKALRPMDQISHQEQKRVELGRCLALEPKLLLLDEPFGGLNAGEIRELSAKLEEIRQGGCALVVIDHHFDALAGMADEIVVLRSGRVLATGPPAAIAADERVRSTYFTSQHKENTEKRIRKKNRNHF